MIVRTNQLDVATARRVVVVAVTVVLDGAANPVGASSTPRSKLTVGVRGGGAKDRRSRRPSRRRQRGHFFQARSIQGIAARMYGTNAGTW